MAIIWMDGPDHYGTNSLLLLGPYAELFFLGIEANAGPGGVGNVFDTGGAQAGFIRKVLPGDRTAIGTGARYRYDSLGHQTIFSFRNGDNGVIGTLELTSTGALRYRNNVNTILWQSDPQITALSWQHIECFVEFSNVALGGKLRVGVDSVSIYENDAIQTLTTAQTCAQISYFGFANKFRDLYIWDTTGSLNNSGMQGDREVLTRYPVSDGTNQDWTPNAGALGWPLISNVPPDDADFISAIASGDLSDFGIGDIPTDITSISAVMLVARGKKSDSGLGTFKIGVSSDGTVFEGAEKAMSTEYRYFSQVVETDPDTTIKWTPAGFNAMLVRLLREE